MDREFILGPFLYAHVYISDSAMVKDKNSSKNQLFTVAETSYKYTYIFMKEGSLQ